MKFILGRVNDQTPICISLTISSLLVTFRTDWIQPKL